MASSHHPRCRRFLRLPLLGAAICCSAILGSPSLGAELVPQAVGSPMPLALDAYDPTVGLSDANYGVHLLPTAADEDQLAIWVRWADLKGSQNEVVGRLFTADGTPDGPRFEVNSARQGFQQNPAVAPAGNRVLVVWRSYVDGVSTILARLLDDQGLPLTDDVTVASSGNPPAAALAPSGLGLVLWTEFVQGTASVHGMLLSDQGAPVADEVPLTSAPVGSSKSSPAAATDANGRFLVVWRSWQQEGNGAGVYGRWLDPSGTPLGPEFKVHQNEIPSEGSPQVAMAPDGTAVVVWDVCDFDHPLLPCEVRARTYNADRTPRGPEVRVSPLTERGHENPAVAIDARGDWAVTYESCRSAGLGLHYDCRITTSFFGPDGEALGEPQQVTADGRPVEPSVAATADGFLVGWDLVACDVQRCMDGHEGVYTQRYRLVDPSQDVPDLPDGGPLTSAGVPGFRFWVRIGGEGSGVPVRAEASCIPETLCVSGAVPGRSELFLRVVGPKPNGYLWPTIVKFTTSEVEVWVEQVSSSEMRYYRLEGASAGSSELPGLFDRTGFQP